MSFGAWLALTFAGLWIGTMLALVSGFWASLELVGVLVLLMAAILVIGMVFHARSVLVAGAVGLLVVAGLGIATALAPSI